MLAEVFNKCAERSIIIAAPVGCVARWLQAAGNGSLVGVGESREPVGACGLGRRREGVAHQMSRLGIMRGDFLFV